MSAFALEDGVVYHTYSAYARGLDGRWGMYQWLDRTPKRAQRDLDLVAPPRRVRQRVKRAREHPLHDYWSQSASGLSPALCRLHSG